MKKNDIHKKASSGVLYILTSATKIFGACYLSSETKFYRPIRSLFRLQIIHPDKIPVYMTALGASFNFFWSQGAFLK